MAKKNPSKKLAKKLTTPKQLAKKRQNSLPSVEVAPPVLSRQERKAQARQALKERNQLIQFTLVSLVVSGFIGLLVGLMVDPALGGSLTGVLVCLALSFKYPRQALYAFIIFIPFAGTVVYAFGDGNAVLQLAKDVFYFPALFGVIQVCRNHRLPLLIPKSIGLPLGLLITIVVMTILLVNVPQQFQAGTTDQPILMGILGLKILVGYLPLITCIFYAMKTKEDLYFLLRLQVVLVLIACGLGFIQYLMLKTGYCAGTQGSGLDLFRASLEARCFVGGSLLYTPSQGQIRLPGTFTAPWQWGWFLISSAFFSFGTTFNDRSPFWRLMGAASLVSVFIMAVVSGQRIALLMVPIIVLGLCLLTGQLSSLKQLKRFIPVGMIVVLVLLGLVIRNPELVQERITSLQDRWNASPPQQFVMNQFAQVGSSQNGILGNGVGRATNSARIFGETRLIESYHPKLLYEMGPLGLAAVLLLYTVLTIATWKAYRQTKDKNLRGYAASLWLFVLLISYFPYYYPLDVDPVGVYYWLAIGVVLKMPTLDKQERELTDSPSGQRRTKKLKQSGDARVPEYV
jgi:hypothetical protein